MGSAMRYLNGILTVLAVLLTLQLWTQWTTGGVAGGAPLTLASEAQAAGIPNAGAQRKQMVDLLKKQSSQLDKLIGLFQSGQAKVMVKGSDK